MFSLTPTPTPHTRTQTAAGVERSVSHEEEKMDCARAGVEGHIRSRKLRRRKRRRNMLLPFLSPSVLVSLCSRGSDDGGSRLAISAQTESKRKRGRVSSERTRLTTHTSRSMEGGRGMHFALLRSTCKADARLLANARRKKMEAGIKDVLGS